MKKLDPSIKLDIPALLEGLKDYHPRRRGWTWREPGPQTYYKFVYRDMSVPLKHSIGLPASDDDRMILRNLMVASSGLQAVVALVRGIDGGAADGIEVDYRLRRKDRKEDGPWMVIDVIVEGVSLVSSYRAQFAEVLGHEDPGELATALVRLRDHRIG